MKIRTIATVFTAICLLTNSIAYCDDGPSYDDTVQTIKETMVSNTSVFRQESYGYIKFDKCSLDYNVRGTFPSGGLYDIKFSNIDFSSLNSRESKVGRDYTAFVILNFKNAAHYKIDDKDIKIHTVVVNVSDLEKAQVLYKAFSRLGNLCGATAAPQLSK
jgi:hypothetical protein